MSEGGTHPRVLIVEDEADIRELMRYNLEREGFAVEEAGDGAQALDKVAPPRPRPAGARPDAARDARARESAGRCAPVASTARLPILIVTAKGTEVDKVLGLRDGRRRLRGQAVQPARAGRARQGAAAPRQPASSPSRAAVYERGRLKIDFGTYQVFVEGNKRELALREFELLKFFVQHPMRVYTREQLLDMVWGRDTFVEPRTVDVHVRRLRQHIERDDANPELILTVRSVGYRFNPEALG